MDDNADDLAWRVLQAASTGSRLQPITEERPHFGLRDAYAVSSLVTQMRIARGERPVGWKIGFTNTTIWDEYGVHAPIWGPMFDSTVRELGPDHAGGRPTCPLAHLAEPRIEPEIVFRLARPPSPEMEEADVLGCIEAVAHGFEIVQSLFPGWRFKAADTVAAFALHGALRHGPFVPVAAFPAAVWLASLSDFRITLFREDQEVDQGVAANVLGGPLSALRHLAGGMTEYPTGFGLRSGDLVTTGTITRAFPIQPGETWRTEVVGLPVSGALLTFT